MKSFIASLLLCVASVAAQRLGTFEEQLRGIGDIKFHKRHDYNGTGRALDVVDGYDRWDTWMQNDYFWVRVYIDPTYSSTSKNTIIVALRKLQYRSKVIKFRFLGNKPADGQVDYIHIKEAGGCWSWFARTEYSKVGQTLSLEDGDVYTCIHTATIQHEMYHALGFVHEHVRPDRDDHIKINFQNVDPEYIGEFEIETGADTMGIPYDFDSIMHYDEYAWSKGNGLKTIEPLNNNIIGRRDDASWWDIVQLRLAYQCRSGRRTFADWKLNRCTRDCKCFYNEPGCRKQNVCGENDKNCQDSFCNGDLICEKNVCKKGTRDSNNNTNNNNNDKNDKNKNDKNKNDKNKDDKNKNDKNKLRQRRLGSY